MAFPNPPKTWSAAAVLTAAQMNAELRDAMNALLPLNIVAWTSYTPTLTQSGAVTKTVTRAKYQQIGKNVTVSVFLTVTGTGTASNAITVSLPVTASSATSVTVGAGHVYDSSAAAAGYFVVEARMSTTTVVSFFATGGNSAVGAAIITAALANNDEVAFEITYEAA